MRDRQDRNLDVCQPHGISLSPHLSWLPTHSFTHSFILEAIICQILLCAGVPEAGSLVPPFQSCTLPYGRCEPHAATGHSKRGQSELRHAVSVKYTLDSKRLVKKKKKEYKICH